MTAPFTPKAPTSSPSTTSTPAGYLPNGQYDYYNVGQLGALYNQKVIYLGPTQAPGVPHSPNGQDLVPGEVEPADPTPQMASPLEYVREFAQRSVTDPQLYAALQNQLFQAGFYGTSKPVWGVWSATDDGDAMVKAITNYVGIASNPNNPNPITFSDYLDQAAVNGFAQAQQETKSKSQSSAASVTKPTFNVQDPTTIAAAAQSAFQASLGRAATKTELKKFISKFQEQQIAAQKIASQPGGGGTYTAPDLTNDAMAFAQSSNPREFANQQANAYMNALLNMFLPAESQRANIPIATPANAPESPYPSQGNTSTEAAAPSGPSQSQTAPAAPTPPAATPPSGPSVPAPPTVPPTAAPNPIGGPGESRAE